MDFLKSYLKQKRSVILLFILFMAVYTVVFILYKISLKAIVYPALLVFVAGLAALIYDFGKAKKKHDKLSQLKSLTDAMTVDLPEPKQFDDEDYQRIIKMLKDESARKDEVYNMKYADTIEYYTVWVHQIKTPIAAMQLRLQSEDSPLTRKLNADLFRIEQYVEMVLAYLRLDSTSTDYVFKEYRLDNLIRQSVRKFSSEFIGKKIRLDYEPIEKVVLTDEKWFSFVIEQLLSNALKYTRSGSIKIYMADENKLCIEDTGIGIASEDLPRVFEKGYTGYNGRMDKKASGLGLYLCKRVCDNLSIKISAESEINVGTKIILDLEQYKLRKE